MDRNEILALNVSGLKDKLAELGLSTNGLKVSLQNRLLEHFGLTASDETASEYDDVGSNDMFFRSAAVVERTTFSLRDIEESLTSFTGSGHPSVEEWLSDFETNAEAVHWNNLQKFIYSKQLLKGAAKIFLRSQRNVIDWNSLKSALREEFGSALSSLEVHKMLKNRRKKQNEDFKEYLYTLMEIGKSINLDDASLIEYFIEGIPDTRQNKSNLYQAKNMKELKYQIEVYEKVRPGKQQSVFVSSPNVSGISVSNSDKKCYKCGNSGHIARNCIQKSFKCFKCGQIGHRAADCKIQNSNIKSEKNVNTMADGSFKENFKTLLDTGCDLCLIRKDTLNLLDGIELDKEKHCLVGIGDSKLITIGSFTTLVLIDGIQLKIKFHVVRDSDINYCAVLGNDLLKSVDLMLTASEARFRRKESNQERLEGLDEISDAKQINSKLFDFSENKKDYAEYNNLEILNEFKELCMTLEIQNDSQVDVDLSHLNAVRAETVKAMINSYEPVNNPQSPIEMKITLSDTHPVYERPRRVSYADKCLIDKQIEDWLKDEIIRPSTSEYASAVVLVSKKDGGKRLCCDYRRLNEKIIRDNFPMPLIDDVLERLQGAQVFTTLDLRNGFFHVPVEESSRKYTAFVTPSGQFEFLYVPFGISNSPATFTRYISAVFRDFINDGTVVIYMDDLVIPSKDINEGIHKLNLILHRASSSGLKIKWSKCQFLQTRIDFLGYIVENNSIRPSEAKTSAIKNFPVPTNQKSLQRFLGLTSYFRRFIENYSMIAKPLSDLLRKDIKFVIDEPQLAAFQQLKSSLIKAPVLKLYNVKALTEVHTDASMHGYGAVLLQKDFDDQEYHPVQFMSRKTKPEEEKYHSYELEVLAIVEALKKWKVYLLGIKFKIVTDCNAFAQTMRKREVPARVTRWGIFLQDFDFEIEHRTGSKMRHVDALSRVSCLFLEDSLTHRLKQAQLEDHWIRAIRKILEKGDYEDFFMKHDILYKNPIMELVVVPAMMEEEIIRIAHKQGHLSIKNTQEAIEKSFYIPELSSKVPIIVRNCIECIVAENKTGKKEGLLSPINKEDRPLRTYHIDHVGPMETTGKGYNYILVIVDAFSKFVWLYPTKNTGAEAVVDRLAKQAALFGNPERIISDRGTAFTSHHFKQYCENQNIQHILIATGVPRGNGQVERIHKIIIPMISKLCVESPGSWFKHVERVQQIVNNTPPRSTKYSPFQILTGLEMRVAGIPNMNSLIETFAIENLDNERDCVRLEAKANIKKIQEENKKYYNKKHKMATSYSKDQLVAIKRTQFGTGLKLKPKFFGPYKVLRGMNHDRYEVEKVGDHEGPNRTTTVAEHMKPWSSAFEPNAAAGWPIVGSGKITRTGRNY